MARISKYNELNLTEESTEDLELMLRNELYMDIDSPFAKEIQEELEERNGKEDKEPKKEKK